MWGWERSPTSKQWPSLELNARMPCADRLVKDVRCSHGWLQDSGMLGQGQPPDPRFPGRYHLLWCKIQYGGSSLHLPSSQTAPCNSTQELQKFGISQICLYYRPLCKAYVKITLASRRCTLPWARLHTTWLSCIRSQRMSRPKIWFRHFLIFLGYTPWAFNLLEIVFFRWPVGKENSDAGCIDFHV